MLLKVKPTIMARIDTFADYLRAINNPIVPKATAGPPNIKVCY